MVISELEKRINYSFKNSKILQGKEIAANRLERCAGKRKFSLVQRNCKKRVVLFFFRFRGVWVSEQSPHPPAPSPSQGEGEEKR